MVTTVMEDTTESATIKLKRSAGIDHIWSSSNSQEYLRGS